MKFVRFDWAQSFQELEWWEWVGSHPDDRSSTALVDWQAAGAGFGLPRQKRGTKELDVSCQGYEAPKALTVVGCWQEALFLRGVLKRYVYISVPWEEVAYDRGSPSPLPAGPPRAISSLCTKDIPSSSSWAKTLGSATMGEGLSPSSPSSLSERVSRVEAICLG